MIISVSKPSFKKDFLDNLNIAVNKGVTVEINQDSETKRDKAIARANGRVVGKMVLERKKGEAIAKQSIIIERDFYPYEVILFELVKYYKRRRIKQIVA